MMNRALLQRQMFANGGAAVPNEYKGFSKLPEEVQMKMDPVAAKKYQEGGVAGLMSAPEMTAMPMGSTQEAVDPAILETALQGASEEVGDLELSENIYESALEESPYINDPNQLSFYFSRNLKSTVGTLLFIYLDIFFTTFYCHVP